MSEFEKETSLDSSEMDAMASDRRGKGRSPRTSEDVQLAILKCLATSGGLLAQAASTARFTPLTHHYYSFGFRIRQASEPTRPWLYVKVPKSSVSKRMMLPITEEDRTFAEAEYASLTLLARRWRADDLQVRFVKPGSFIKDFNAIVTQEVVGREFFELLRAWDRRGRFGGMAEIDPMANVMLRLGQAIARFHDNALTECEFDWKDSLLKIDRYRADLVNRGVSKRRLDTFADRLRRLKAPTLCAYRTTTLKGLDVRNVLFDETSGDVWLVDPGRMKEDYREADLARFIATCRVVHWGSLNLLFWGAPRRLYEESLLRGYYGCGRPQAVLFVLIIKELFKHWYMAHTAVDRKSWRRSAQVIARKTYVDRFFQKELSEELAQLEGLLTFEHHMRSRYRSSERARSYRQGYSESLSWQRFTMWRERNCVARSLKGLGLRTADRVLDMPCGTGVLSSELVALPCSVIASDIAREMIAEARSEYGGNRFRGFVVTDALDPAFRGETFTCVVTIGFLHRLPDMLRQQAIRAIARIAQRYVILSCSVASPVQRLKKTLVGCFLPGYHSAPNPVKLSRVLDECALNRLKVHRIFRVVPALSAEIILVLEKSGMTSTDPRVPSNGSVHSSPDISC